MGKYSRYYDLIESAKDSTHYDADVEADIRLILKQAFRIKLLEVCNDKIQDFFGSAIASENLNQNAYAGKYRFKKDTRKVLQIIQFITRKRNSLKDVVAKIEAEVKYNNEVSNLVDKITLILNKQSGVYGLSNIKVINKIQKNHGYLAGEVDINKAFHKMLLNISPYLNKILKLNARVIRSFNREIKPYEDKDEFVKIVKGILKKSRNNPISHEPLKRTIEAECDVDKLIKIVNRIKD